MRNYIYIGSMTSPSFAFDDDSIMSVSLEMASNIIGKELSCDAFEAQVECNDSAGDLRALPYATPIFYVRDAMHTRKYYFTKITRIGKTRYKIEGKSFVGILETKMFYGGLFRQFSLPTLVQAIIASNLVSRYMQLQYIRTGPAAGATTVEGIKLSSGSVNVWANELLHIKFKLAGVITYSTTEYAIAGSPFGTDYGYGLTLKGNGTSSGVNIFELRLRYCYNWHTIYSQLKIGDAVTIDINGDSVRNLTCDWVVDHEDGTQHSGSASLSFRDFIPGQMKIFGGGVSASNTFEAHPYLLDIYHYQLYYFNRTLDFDAVPLLDTPTGKIIIRDTVSGYTAELPGATSDPGTMTNRTGDYFDTMEMDETARDILASIEFDADVAAMTVTGWLKIDTKRNALYQVLFAACANILRTKDGKVRFAFLDATTQEGIDEESMYNEGGVEEPVVARKISLTENSIDYIGDEEVVFDNSNDSASSGTYLAMFDKAPIASEPVAEGLTIHSWSNNAAVVSGAGTIRARVYHCSRKVIEKTFDDVVVGSDIVVSDAQLVTFVNSENVFQRLLSYYGSAYKVRASFLYSGERPGFLYSFLDCFGDRQVGFLEHTSLRLSEKAKATSEFICGYVPPNYGNLYTNSVVLTGSGSWSVPAAVYEKDEPQIRVVLIGGGNGGYSGVAGQDAVEKLKTEYKDKTSAKGGAYGKPGASGKILDFVIKNPASSLSYSCGTGGAGGTCQSDGKSGAGGSGTPTTIRNGSTTYTSANGEARKLGILDIFHNINYGYETVIWDETGGKGGDGGYVYISDQGYPYNGYSFVRGGSAYNPVTGETFEGGLQGGFEYNQAYASPGAGGGAAVGAAGNRGGGVITDTSHPSYEHYIPGKGGNGADATYVPAVAFLGCGGAGGAGGGGAGSVGFYTPDCEEKRKMDCPYAIPKGGRGGVGGKGGAGCIIIYY